MLKIKEKEESKISKKFR